MDKKGKKYKEQIKAFQNKCTDALQRKSAVGAIETLILLNDLEDYLHTDNAYEEIKVNADKLTRIINDDLNLSVSQCRLNLRHVARQIDYYKERQTGKLYNEKERYYELLHRLSEINNTLWLSDFINNYLDLICQYAQQWTIRGINSSQDTINTNIKPIYENGIKVEQFLNNALVSQS